MIPGVGKQKARALLKSFGSVKAVREAPPESLYATPGITPQIVNDLKAFFETRGNLPEDEDLREIDED